MAESYEFLDKDQTAIFHIRKGIRWSDGVPRMEEVLNSPQGRKNVEIRIIGIAIPQKRVRIGLWKRPI